MILEVETDKSHQTHLILGDDLLKQIVHQLLSDLRLILTGAELRGGGVRLSVLKTQTDWHQHQSKRRPIKGGRQGRHQYKYKKWQKWHQEQYKIGHQE